MSLAVYGNLIIDQIVTFDEPFRIGGSHRCTLEEKQGGIANFRRAYSGPLQVEVASISKAAVIANKWDNTRTGFVEWGEQHYDWKPVKADWHHIMYFDRLNITPQQLASFDRVSVDFCEIDDLIDFREVYDPYLRLIDLLIVSELSNAFGSLRDSDIDVDMIVHSPERIYYKRKGKLDITYEIEKIDGLNVTGAGDYLAANCLVNILATGDPNLPLAHSRTLKLLKEQS